MIKLRAVLKRRWLILVISLVLGASGGVISSQFAQQNVARLYTAGQVIVANSSSGAVSLVAQDTLKVNRGQVPILAAKRLGTKEDPNVLAAQVFASFDAKSGAITVASNDLDPKVASRRVEAFVEAFLQVTNERLTATDRRQLAQVEEDLKAAQAELKAFDEKNPQFTGSAVPTGVSDIATQTLLSQRAQLLGKISDLQEQQRTRELALLRSLPYETLGPETPRPAQSGLIDVPASKTARAVLLGFLGLLLGAGVTMLIERVNRRIDTREELVDITDLPILAEIGYVPEKRRAVDGRGRVALAGIWAEPYRRVRSAIQFVQANAQSPGSTWAPYPGSPSDVYGTPPAVFLVTSASPAEGKSTTSALVALALAEVAVPTVLVGGDFRKPQIDRLVGASRSPSLQDLASLSVARPTVDDIVQATEIDHLYAATAGEATREVAGLVEAAKTVCTEAVARGATVIIDSSPLQAANDTLDLLPTVDYVIFVLRVGKSTEGDLLDAIATLRRMESRILGIVLIGTPAGRKQEYYYDYYSHGPVEFDDGSGPGGVASNGAASNGAATNGAAANGAGEQVPVPQAPGVQPGTGTSAPSR